MSHPILFKEEGVMAKPMTKSQIVDHIAKKADIKKVQAVMILDEIAKLVYKEAKNSFTLPGIGKIVLVQRKARKGRNPQTGDVIKIPAKKVVKFRVAKAAKDAIFDKK
jgi:DNA-binding protein HU-beta